MTVSTPRRAVRTEGLNMRNENRASLGRLSALLLFLCGQHEGGTRQILGGNGDYGIHVFRKGGAGEPRPLEKGTKTEPCSSRNVVVW